MTPSDSYHEALSSHRHYDSMANTALSLLGAAIAGGPSLYGVFSKQHGAELILVITALIIVYAVQTYKRFDSYAGTALNVAVAIENADPRFQTTPIGFATVFAHPTKYPDLQANGESRTYKRIRLIGFLLTTLLITTAIAISIANLTL